MTNYIDFEAEDFAQDEFFIEWVNNPDIKANVFWQNWLETFPHKLQDVRMARQLVLFSSGFEEHEKLSPDEASELKNAIFCEINNSENQFPFFLGRTSWLYIAASILGIGIALSWFVTKELDTDRIALTRNSFGQKVLVQNLEQVNKLVILPDGSSVLLGTNSSISYTDSLKGTKREVNFSGNGFFEISKNPEKPFYVHTQGIVTKVLGTSFEINAPSENSNISVKVKTGRVAVFREIEANMHLNLNEKNLTGLVLEPDDLIVFEKGSASFREIENTKLSKEILHDLAIVSMKFEYEEVPISSIFKDLEDAYQMEIVYDSALIVNSRITASIADEPLINKMDLLSKAIRCQYKIVGNKIIVYKR